MARVVLAAVLAAGSGASIVHGQDGAGEGYELRVLSSRPEMVTGGNALVAVGRSRPAPTRRRCG